MNISTNWLSQGVTGSQQLTGVRRQSLSLGLERSGENLRADVNLQEILADDQRPVIFLTSGRQQIFRLRAAEQQEMIVDRQLRPHAREYFAGLLRRCVVGTDSLQLFCIFGRTAGYRCNLVHE